MVMLVGSIPSRERREREGRKEGRDEEEHVIRIVYLPAVQVVWLEMPVLRET